MRVLAINQFYAPDHSASAQLLTDLCEDLVAMGHQVSVIASQGSYDGGNSLPAKQTIRGVEVHRPPATSFGKATAAHRLADYLSFWATSLAAASLVSRPDVILALTTPPLIPAGAALVSQLRRVPLVTWVQDVYPEAAVALGAISAGSPAVQLFAGLTRATHLASARIVALSEGMVGRLNAQGAPPRRTAIIHNWADGAELQPIPHEQNTFRTAHDLEGRFVAMYSGNLGQGHDAATLIDAARVLAKSHPKFRLVFVGGGVRVAEARALAADLENVIFLPYQPRERLAESLSAADIHCITLRDGLDGLLVPSKLYGALAVDRPVLYIGPQSCEVARVVRQYGVGWAFPSGAADEVAECLRKSMDGRPAGASSRAVFSSTFDRPFATRRWERLLREAAGV